MAVALSFSCDLQSFNDSLRYASVFVGKFCSESLYFGFYQLRLVSASRVQCTTLRIQRILCFFIVFFLVDACM